MKHPTEEQLIDHLLVSPDPAITAHLETCEMCAEAYANLEAGLTAARMSKPRVPLMPVPHVSYRAYRKSRSRARMTWIAAAAVLILSIGGFRMEFNEGGLAMQFGLPGFSSGKDAGRIAQLEAQLEKLELISAARETRMFESMETMDAQLKEYVEYNQGLEHMVRYNALKVQRQQGMTRDQLNEAENVEALKESLQQ